MDVQSRYQPVKGDTAMTCSEFREPLQPDEPGGQTRRFALLERVGTSFNKELQLVTLHLVTTGATEHQPRQFEVALTPEMANGVIEELLDAVREIS